MEKRWRILTTDEVIVQTLHQSLKVHPVLCKIFVQRGLESFDQAKKFFRPRLTELHSPWLMKDMGKAVDRIVAALKSNEKILVFGDYDVDGTTSVASMFQFLKKVHSNIDFYIPHRYREGYGVSKAGIDFAQENGFGLIISLDCGIKSADLDWESILLFATTTYPMKYCLPLSLSLTLNKLIAIIRIKNFVAAVWVLN
jgi:single-stranded-DNA-specific exonuclease